MLSAGLGVALLMQQHAQATDVPGVHPAAWDQPQVSFALVRPGDECPRGGILLFDVTYKALLDTGASGVVLDSQYASPIFYDLPLYDHLGQTVVFSDVGIGDDALEDSVDYNVSAELLELRLAPFPGVGLYTCDPDDPDDVAAFNSTFNQISGPGRLQIGPISGGLSPFDINIVGMPAMTGKVVVVDPKPLDTFLLGSPVFDQLHTYVYDPGTPFNPASSDTNPGIPATDRHVRLTMVDVSRFTETIPAGAEPPTLADNPFIGLNPVARIDSSIPAGSTPGVTVSRGALRVSGSFLFDTGSALTFISRAMAVQLNVRYRAGTYGTASPVLEEFDPDNPGVQGTALADQFTTVVTGAGGPVTVAGFGLDGMLLHTIEGNAADPNDPNHLNYTGAPVYVYDIALLDKNPAPGNDDTLILDGVLGMNVLAASAVVDLSNPLVPVIVDVRLSPFDWIVFDEPNARFGVALGPSIDDDRDDDAVRDGLDICPLVADPDQANQDGDADGNVCDDDVDGDGDANDVDADDDNDGVPDTSDNCPIHANADQADHDGDGVGDICDIDNDGDGTPDVTDSDDDNDLLSDEYEIANGLDPFDPDYDGDGIIDGLDRDPWISSNAGDCATMGAVIFDDTPVVGPVTCAASISVTIDSNVEVHEGGDLEVLAPIVEFRPDVKVNGKLTITNIDPAATIGP